MAGPYRDFALPIFLAVVIVVKAAFLIALGPVYLPDSNEYVRFAEIILQGGDWATHLDLSAEVIPLTAFRGAGFPALIAGAMALFGEGWDWALVILQGGLSVGATAMIWRLTLRLTDRIWAAALAASGQALGLAFVLDQCVLSDSLNATATTFLAAYMASALLDGRKPRLIETLGLGVILLAAFFVREAGAIMHLALWPIVIAWGLRTGTGVLRTALTLAVFLTPLMAGIQGYKSWNQMRSGERFITTVGQTAMYHPVVDLARKGYPVFAEDPLLADADLLPLPSNPGVAFTAINVHLIKRHGMNAVQIARHADAQFFDHWRRYPLARAKIYLGRFSPRYALLAFMPLTGPERLSRWAGGGSPFPKPGEFKRNLLEHGRIDQAALLAARTLARLISTIISIACLAGVPLVVLISLVRAQGRPMALSSRHFAYAGLWLFVIAYPIAYALVYLEDRYLAAVSPIVAVLGIALLAPWVDRGIDRGATWIVDMRKRRSAA